MKTRLGGILAIVLGAVLITLGATGAGSSVGIQPIYCGGAAIGAVVPTCKTGHIDITKVVDGNVDLAPDSGWDFTITSEDCSILQGSSTKVHIDAGGGMASSDDLYVDQLANGGDPCHYTVTETAVAGWTATYDPTGLLVLPDDEDTDNVVSLTITNTQPVETTTPAPSTSTTTTTITPTASASAEPTDALANTGSHNALPETITGIGLVVLGGVMLLLARRPRRQEH